MTDRELLEKAAKAAGIEWNRTFYRDTTTGLPLDWDQATGNIDYWNPLADDGDALRLAVELRIDIKFYANMPFNGLPHRVICGVAYKLVTQSAEGYADNPSAATRRAIVRAAAALADQATG